MSGIREIWLHAHRMLRSGRRIINENLKPLGLSSSEGNILLHLLTQGADLPQEQLVEQLDVSKPAISRVLVSLEEKGFITRHPDPHDRRAFTVRLTVRAQAAGPAIEQAYNRLYELALQGIPREELERVLPLLARVGENLARGGQSSEGGAA